MASPIPPCSRCAALPRSTGWARSRYTPCEQVDLDLLRIGSSSCCSGRRDPASRRCSTSSAASTCRRAGTVRYRDTELTAPTNDPDRLSPPARRLRLPVLQLIPSLTARENVALVTEISEQPMTPRRGARPGRSRRAARPLSLAAVRRRAAARGDRARHRQAAGGAALRRADRRAGHLDRHRRARGAGRVNRELGTTTIVITHNAAIAAMADRVIRLADGRIASIEDRTAQGVGRRSCRGEAHDGLRAQPQAAARPGGR